MGSDNSKYKKQIDRRNDNPQRYAQPANTKKYALYRNGNLLFSHDDRIIVLDYLATIYPAGFSVAMKDGGFALVVDGRLQFGRLDEVSI